MIGDEKAGVPRTSIHKVLRGICLGTPRQCLGFPFGYFNLLLLCLPGLVPGESRRFRRACSAAGERKSNAADWPNFHRNSTGYKNWGPAFAGTTRVDKSNQFALAKKIDAPRM